MIIRHHVELDDKAQIEDKNAINRVVRNVWEDILPLLEPNQPMKVDFAVANWPIVWADGSSTEYISVAAEVAT